MLRVLTVVLLVSGLLFPIEVELEGVTELVMTSQRMELEPQVQAEVDEIVEQVAIEVVNEVMLVTATNDVMEEHDSLLPDDEEVELVLLDVLLYIYAVQELTDDLVVVVSAVV